MSRLAQLTDDQVSESAKPLLDGIHQKLGMVPNLYRVLANEPAVLSAILAMNTALDKGSFNAETREAIALAAAGENSCDYCASAHTMISKSLKVEDEEIGLRLRGAASDPKLNAILKFARAVIVERGFVSSAQIDEARAAGLTDGEIVETVGHVVVNIFTNYTNHVAETDIDFPIVRVS